MKKNVTGYVHIPRGKDPSTLEDPFSQANPGSWRWPEYFGELPDATCSACITGPCGETMAVYLKIEDDRVVCARFVTDGCGASAACGALAVKLAQGKDLDQVVAIGSDTLLALLNWLPADHEHCAQLAAEALQAAVHNHFVGDSGRRSSS